VASHLLCEVVSQLHSGRVRALVSSLVVYMTKRTRTALRVHSSVSQSRQHVLHPADVCSDDMHGYQLKAPGRWRSLNVKQKKGQGGKRRRKPKPIVEAQPKSESEKDDSSSSDHDSNEDSDSEAEKERYMPPTIPEPVEETPKAPLEPPPDTAADAPCSRYNAMLAVQKNTLYLSVFSLTNNTQSELVY